MQRLLRGVLGSLVIVGQLTLAACTSTTAPSPTPAPAKATAPVAPATKPATPAAASEAKPAAGQDWKSEWDKTVAAAKAEGKLVVAGARGDLYRKAAMEFQKAYPDIKMEFTGVQGGDFGPQLLAEREAGRYLVDVHMGGSTTATSMFKPKGVLDSVKSALILPEVLDDSKWQGGFEDGWVDRENQYIYQFEGRLTFLSYVNRDMVSESELNSIDQLIDPKWKGKIVSLDPRSTGSPAQHSAYLMLVKGEDWLRKFLSQDLVILKEGRQMAEALVRGRYPIAFALNGADIQQFRQEGLAANIKVLDPDSAAGARLSSGFGNLMLINKAPHPNAAKVFVNWQLSKEGQKAYAEITELNSRRIDVPGPAEFAPRPNVKYLNIANEEYKVNVDKAMNIAKEIIK